MNLYAVNLEWSRLDDPAFEDVLRTVGERVQRSKDRIDDAHASGNAEYADDVTDDECALVEALLGLAFVMCQAQITRVVSGVMWMHDHAIAESPAVSLTSTSGKKADILKHGSAGKPFANVEVVDAFANYYKHESEWRHWDWTKLTGLPLRTATVIQTGGASPGSSGNLRSGFQAVLGHCNYERVEDLAGLVTAWKASLLAAYEAELRTVGLM